MIERRPALVVRPRDSGDVLACVRFARDSWVALSVRSGCNIAGTALCAGGVMIDFSTHKAVEVDSSSARVEVQPGATWADVDRATGVRPRARRDRLGDRGAGFTLGGGFGWVTRRYGFAADQLVAADVVTADGQARGAADDNPDLFWAMRRRRQLGLVTSFEFQGQPRSEVIAGLVLHPMARAEEVLALFRAATPRPRTGCAICWSCARRRRCRSSRKRRTARRSAASRCYSGPLDEEEAMAARSSGSAGRSSIRSNPSRSGASAVPRCRPAVRAPLLLEVGLLRCAARGRR